MNTLDKQAEITTIAKPMFPAGNIVVTHRVFHDREYFFVDLHLDPNLPDNVADNLMSAWASYTEHVLTLNNFGICRTEDGRISVWA